MAAVIWVGTTATWTTAANWSPAAAPVDTESPTFTGAVTQNIDGLSLGAGADDFAAVVCHEDMAHDIGSSGTPVTAGTVTKLQFASRSGRCYWTTANGKTLTQCIYKAASGRSDALTLGAAGTGAITTLRVMNASGGLVLNSGAVTTIEMINSPNCTLVIASAVTALASIYIQGGGTIDNSALVSTGAGSVEIDGGRYIRRGTGTTLLLKMSGGLVPSIFEDFGSGTITAGVLSGRGVTYDGRGNRSTAVTITAISQYNQAAMLLDNGMSSYTITTLTSDGTGVNDGATITNPPVYV